MVDIDASPTVRAQGNDASESSEQWGHFIELEIAWFQEILDLRLKDYMGQEETDRSWESTSDLVEGYPPPELPKNRSPYADVVEEMGLGAAERLVLLLAFLPHIRPQVLDAFFLRNRPIDRGFTEFGGREGRSHRGFLPTGETAIFLLAGGSAAARLKYHELLTPQHPLFRRGVLCLDAFDVDEPRLAAPLVLVAEYRERLLTGAPYEPAFSAAFPAQRLTTRLQWEDLVMDPNTRYAVEEIVTWVEHQETLLYEWGLERRLKQGYRALFYGPPGTGKTLTASLLGKKTGRVVYRIDLAKLVSKYIGETEKNLARLLDQAEHRGWILFFDEAESLFGQRTATRSSNDRFANQQVAYLLQRIEDYSGVALLATNLSSQLDDAFARRFQAMIHFPIPDTEQRLRLWQDHFRNQTFTLADDVELEPLARTHELAGGTIVNILRFAALRAVCRQPAQVHLEDLEQGIRQELHKEGKYASGI